MTHLQAAPASTTFPDRHSGWWHGLGAAYLHFSGAVLVVWPEGPRRAQATYNEPAEGCFPVEAAHWLLALGLTEADCRRLAAVDPLRPGGQRRRAAFAEGLSARRAQERAALLRALRRGDQPRGSICIAGGGGGGLRPRARLRFADGSGWWGCTEYRCRPWLWTDGRQEPVLRVLATGLDDEQLRLFADCREPEAAEARLRERGLA